MRSWPCHVVFSQETRKHTKDTHFHKDMTGNTLVVMRAQVILFWSAIFLSTIAHGCTFSIKPIRFDDDRKVAAEHVKKFHSFYNEGRFDEAYSLFSAKGRESLDVLEFSTRLESLHRTSGRIVNSRVVATDERIVGSATLVHVTHETEFEKAIKFEEFDCRVSNGTVVFDYYGHPERVPTPMGR